MSKSKASAATLTRIAAKTFAALPGSTTLNPLRDTIADRAVEVGACTSEGRGAFRAWLSQDREGALDAIIARTPGTGTNTPAAPVAARSDGPVTPAATPGP